MISQQLVEEILRCPLNPSRTRLAVEGNHLVCQQCRLRFQMKDGFPVLVVEDAELPAGCAELSQLPCQADRARTP